MSNHHLTPEEQQQLTAVNEVLTRLTVAHHHICECELCGARMLTDVQDMPGLEWTVGGVTLAAEEDEPKKTRKGR
jgi:hypothetical protein